MKIVYYIKIHTHMIHTPGEFSHCFTIKTSLSILKQDKVYDITKRYITLKSL